MRRMKEGYFDEDEAYEAFKSNASNMVDLGDDPSAIYDQVYDIAMDQLERFVTSGYPINKSTSRSNDAIACKWTEKWMDENLGNEEFLDYSYPSEAAYNELM